jgi:hypothetical protein
MNDAEIAQTTIQTLTDNLNAATRRVEEIAALDVGTDDTIRADLDAVPNAGTIGDARRRINRHVLTDPTAAWY